MAERAGPAAAAAALTPAETRVGPESIAAAFAGQVRRAALMPYLMAGFPDLDASAAAAEVCAAAGADLLELGVPFSDPLADGPAIHSAGSEALRRGATVDGALAVCRTASARLPVVLMAYANVLLARGEEQFCAAAAEAGASGLIVPDLPHDEAAGIRGACDRAGLALVPLVAPTTEPDRAREIAAAARGFVYTVALAGTTGERDELPADLAATVGRVRAAASVPVAVGFGIATPEQASRVADLADGVIIGSRIVRAAGEGGAAAVGEVVAAFGDALR